MPRKRHDSRSDDTDSYSSDEDSSNKRQHDKRSRKIHVSKSSPLLKKGSSSSVYKDAKGDRDSRYEKEDGDKRYTSANQRHSADRYSHFRDTRRRGEKDDRRREGEKDDRRREGEKNDHRRGSEKDAQRQGGEKDGQRRRTDDRRDETKRNRDAHQRRSGDESRMENWKRSRDSDKEKVKKVGGSRNVSPSREESSRNEGSKSSDDERKTSVTDTRRERKKNSPTGVSNSKEVLKEKEKSRNKMLSDSSRTGEGSQKERNKMEQTTRKQYGEKKDTRGRKKRPTDTSSSSSEDDSSDSESDSESSDSKSDDRMVKARKEPVVSNTGKQESDKQDRTGELKEGKLPVIVKKAFESPQKDSFEEGRSGHSSDESGSDSQKSGDEREGKYSQNKMESNEAKEDDATEPNKHLNKDGNEKRSPGEPQYSLRETVEESRDTGSEEEKEEGEISEDNEDKMPNKPLKSISDYVSDISSDDGNAESLQFTEVQKQHIITNQASPSKPPQTDKGSPENVNQHNKSQKAPQTDKRTVAVVREKSYNDADKVKRDINNFSDREVIDGEDNSKRQRPVLESESDDDSSYDRDNEKSATRSSAHSKQKMGSSVSVVRQTSSRRDGDRSRDRDHEKEQRLDRKEKDIRSRNDNEREKKRDRDGETKRESENVEQKKTVSTKSGKPDDVVAPKNSEDSVKKPVVAFDITTKTGGAYIPPAKLRMMQEQITDKTSVAYQRMSWEALKKSINGLINKVNVSNIIEIIKELFQENIVRGRGLLARSVIQAQAASPTFTHVYAALVAVINTKFPQNGELILRRLILMFRRGYKRNDKALCLSSTRFVAHLVNQQVAHEVLALEILTLLLENPTDDAVEVAIGFLKECGQKLTEVSPRGINSIFERLRNVLHEGQLDMRVQYMVEVMFAIRKDGFKDHQSVLQDLDLVEEDEQFTHLLQLEDVVNGDELLNVFKEDPSYAENEEKYKALKKEILEEGSSDEESGGSSGSDASESDSGDEEAENAEKQAIIDKTETNLIALRRTIYLTVQSSLDHNECAHKMLKMELKPGQEVELCNMILDCCAQLRTYEKFFGLLGQRFCQIDKKYIEPFQQIFIEQYETIHRLETNKLRNVAKFFAHLLYTDAISWGVLSVVKLTEEDTTSASRIFLKILFQELSEYMGLFKLNERLKDPTLAPYFKGIMARDNPKNTRFSINFFTTIGLGGLTDDLREHLKTATKRIAQQNQEADHGESSSSTDASTDSSSDSDSSSASESDSSPRRNQKSSSKKKGKADRESTKSKKRAADKENKRESARKQKSLDSENKSGSKSKSSSKGGKNAKEKNVLQGKSPKTIADRLLDMAEYGNIQNGDEQSRGRNERQKWDGEKEARNQFSRRDEERERRGGQNGREFEDRNRENGERWEQNEKRWNGSEERGDRRQEENFSYRGRNWEDRGQRQEDRRRFEGRQNEFNNFRRREDGSHQRNDGFWDRRHDPGPGNNRYWKSDYDTEESRQNKAGDGDRRRDVRRGEVSADKRYNNSSDEQSESSPDHRKQRKGGNMVSLSSTDRRDMKRSADVDSVQKQASKRRHSRHSSSESSTDSSDDNQAKSSRPGKGHSSSKSDRSQKNTRKKSLSSNDSSAATPTSSSSSSSSDEEEVQERRIITKKPRLSELNEDRNKKGQEVLGERGGEKNRDRRRK